MNAEGLCFPCAHGDHENCNGKCFCPKCWDDEDRAATDDPHEKALETKMLAEAS